LEHANFIFVVDPEGWRLSMVPYGAHNLHEPSRTEAIPIVRIERDVRSQLPSSSILHRLDGRPCRTGSGERSYYREKGPQQRYTDNYEPPPRIIGLPLTSFCGAPLNAILMGILIGVCGLDFVGWRLILFYRSVGAIWFGGRLSVAAAALLLFSFGIVGRKHLCNEMGEIRSYQEKS
jgi:hypothetical protein